MYLDLPPETWGPQYWFFLHTVSNVYSDTPTPAMKRLYYDLFTRFHNLIPHQDSASNFKCLMDAFPISPFLDSRSSLIRWTHFIHNKVNSKLGKREPTFEEATEQYLKAVSPKRPPKPWVKKREKLLIVLVVVCALIGISSFS